eukprot:6393992-Karenia_brevis.AAC.1
MDISVQNKELKVQMKEIQINMKEMALNLGAGIGGSSSAEPRAELSPAKVPERREVRGLVRQSAKRPWETAAGISPWRKKNQK